jgi:hypothetical protein
VSIKDDEAMKALQRFWNWAGNLFGKKVKETSSLPPAPEKTRTPLDEFVEVYSRLIDYPYFSPGFWGAWGKQEHIDYAIAYFNHLMASGADVVFNSPNNIPVDVNAVDVNAVDVNAVDVNAVDDEEDNSPEPVPTKFLHGVYGWAEGEAEEHPAMLELAKQRAKEGWINPHIAANAEVATAKSKKPTKKPTKKPAKKKTKKAAKTRKQGKARS